MGNQIREEIAFAKKIFLHNGNLHCIVNNRKHEAGDLSERPFHFSRIFKRVTGISVRQYLSALRIESGKTELLHSPSLLVKIEMSVGLSSQGTFNTRFKQLVVRSVPLKIPLHR